ncbi:hypothetical protein TKK_0007896 [Trichogramma kaykai]
MRIQGSPDHVSWYRVMNQRMEEDDYGEGFIAESHPLRPTHLNVPLRESRAPSISSSVTDMDVPIYTRDTTIPLSGKLDDSNGMSLAMFKNIFRETCNISVCYLVLQVHM